MGSLDSSITAQSYYLELEIITREQASKATKISPSLSPSLFRLCTSSTMSAEQQAKSPTQENARMPHLEVLDRVMNIPVVQSAIEKTGTTYSHIKDSHHLISWALNYAEAGLHFATTTATPIAVPIAKKFEGHINTVDQKLCQGLDIVEQKVPIVKQPPQQVY